MKLHLNLSLRRALLTAMAAVATLASSATAGVVDTRYDVQYYMDFCLNEGLFAAGATNVTVGYTDGSASFSIPLMPYLGSYAQVVKSNSIGVIQSSGGASLISSQFIYGASHVYTTSAEKGDIGLRRHAFRNENGQSSNIYDTVNIDRFGFDSAIERTDKLVTAVAYTPMASEEFMQSLTTSDWLYRLGHGGTWTTNDEPVYTNNNALGGVVTADQITQNASNKDWHVDGVLRLEAETPLDLGVFSGDSGSPLYAWDADGERFVFVGSMWASHLQLTHDNTYFARYNPTLAQEVINKYNVSATFSGSDTITWGEQNAETGKGVLSQGNVEVEYTGKGSGNTVADTLGLLFSTESSSTQVLELQGNVDLGAGALTFTNGNWKLTEDGDYTLSSAGFEVQGGASLTLELTGTSGEEIRKVGEGTLIIAGSENNEAALVVGGGTVKYELSYDEEGNITGCTLGNVGETRLNRQNGYAASSVRLEGGVASIVLMRDGQFKTNSVAGDTFSFGNEGGLLNLNGHNLTWRVINQDGSGKGARIGNKTPLGEGTPGLSTFTYTGTGTFAGCFVDEGEDSTAQLAVKYNNAAEGATWTLTGNHTNVGGFTVEAGTMVLEGANTSHVWKSDASDWTYATLVGSDVTVKSGAAFQLSHHALMTGNINVESGGTFILNQTINTDLESIGGSLRQDMVQRQQNADTRIVSLIGNVNLGAAGQMVADVSSPAVTVIQGNITGTGTQGTQFTKSGNGLLMVDGAVNVYFGSVENGGLVVNNATGFVSAWTKWTVGKQGFLAIQGLDNNSALSCISSASEGVLALTSNQADELKLQGPDVYVDRSKLYIGAWGENAIEYGTADKTLSYVTEVVDAETGATRNVWRLGGGTGTLNVNFLLTGDADLLIGNEWSSGTVHLTNTNNDIGTIYIQGMGNKLTYEAGALGDAFVSIGYGNALALHESSQLAIIKEGSAGVLATSTSDNLDLRGFSLAIGANGDYTYTGELTVDEVYRFGGSGNLTLDTTLDSGKDVIIDGQGMSDSSVTFARENVHEGDIVAGGGLDLVSPNSTGSIVIHAGHANTFASANSMVLKQGAILDTDGHTNMVVQNLTSESGSGIINSGDAATTLELQVTSGTHTSIADGVLKDANNASALSLVKTGGGTLTMGANASWSGGLTIKEGVVAGNIYRSGDSYYNTVGGIGQAVSDSSAGNVITIEENGTLRITGVSRGGRRLGGTFLTQTVLGTGTIEFSTGGAAFFSTQTQSFEGTVKLMGNTRFYLGKNLATNHNSLNLTHTLDAVQDATIVVTDGSQVRITSSLAYLKNTRNSVYTDFVISGTGFKGVDNNSNSDESIVFRPSSLNGGALSIDGDSTVYGNVTLADDAVIASWSNGLGSVNTRSDAAYGIKGYLGGTIRGQILGEGKDLTIGGNESITFTADSENTFRNLIIANGNGNNDDQFALRLNGGKAVSQTSTALGTGNVTLNDGLILRLAGTGTANQTDVEYTYANNIAAGNGSTIQSYNITNKLTGVVTAAGDLNLATAQGGVLNLAGGVSGSGTLNVGAGSKVILGDGISGTVTFGGNVVAGAGADFTLESVASLAATSTISGTDSLTLRLSGTADYTLGGITMAGADSALTLHFDFTQAGSSEYTTLNSSIASSATSIAIDLNMFNDITEGNYTLISGSLGNTNYTLADTYGDRLSLVVGDGSLTLQVGPEGRLYWAADSASQEWNTSDANWKVGNKGDAKAYSGTAEVMLTSTGHSTAGTRETITVSEGLKVGKVNVSSLYEINGGGSLNGTQLSVGDGGDLQLGVDATFTSGVLVNDGTLTVEGKTVTANVSAENGAEVNLNGTTLQGNMMVGSESAVNMDAASITGSVSTPASGAIALKNASLSGTFSTDSGAMVLNADNLVLSSGSFESSAQLLAGSMTVAGGAFTLKGTSEIEKLTVNSGQTATLYNVNGTMGSNKKIDTLALANGATLAIQNTTAGTSVSGVIDTLQLAGTGTIKEVQDSGYLKIGSLALAEGSTKGSLQVSKANTNGTAAYTSVIEFGSATASAGNFAGEIVLSNAKISDSQNHSLFVTLAGKEIFSDAVVKMTTQECTGGYLGLGIMADEATIGGLESSSSLGNRALLFSGESKRGVGWNTGDVDNHQMQNSAARTLIIDTDADTSSTFNGRVMNNLSIVKTGEGTQIFNGKSTGHGSHNFNGSIEVQEGTLAFTGDALGMLSTASSVAVNGGTLDISSYDFSSGPLAVNNFSFSEDSVLALGNLQADTTYNFFTTALENWMSLTADNFTINGTALSDWQRASLNLGMDGSFSYSIDSWNLVWKGGSEGNWTTASGNEAWQTTDASSDGSTTSTGFSNGDNVTFESGTTVTLGSDIMVSTMNVNSGTVVVKDSGSFAFNAGTVNVAANSHMQMWGDTGNAGADNVLSKVVMAEGATLSTNNRDIVSAATTVDTLVLNGKTANLKDVHHSGYIKVNELRLGEGIASSKLVLTKTSDSANVSVFEFGGASTDAGNFIGTLELIGGATISSSSGARSAGIIISHNTIARNAAISLSSNTSSHLDSYLTLGINTANATIAGLSSGSSLGNHAVLYSGAVMSNEAWGESKIDNGSTRTLTIETGKGTEDTFYGKVVNTDSSKLNLVKSGEGTQNFLGSGSFGSVTVKGGTLTLGGSMTVEVSTDANRTFEVAQDAKLTISSSATFTNTGSVKLNKTGAGTMIVNSKISQNWLDILTGTFEVGYTGDDGNTITNIDAGISGSATGQVLVKKGAQLTSTKIWMKNGTIALEEGGMLDYKGATIIGESPSATAVIQRTNKNSGGEYTGVGDGNITISDAHVKYTGEAATLNNKLVNSTVENAGSGVLTVSNAANMLSGVVASKGDVTLQNLAAATSLNLLEIAAGRTMNAYVGTNVNEKQTVTVSGTALLSGTSTLNTSLTLNAGATLDMVDMIDGAAIVTGALTFEGQLTMGDKLLAILDEMSSWENHELTLITGLDSFTFDGVEVEDGSMLQASTYFSNVSDTVSVSYRVSGDVGSLVLVSMDVVPEPTTSTLSLLALAGLCARRRRKD